MSGMDWKADRSEDGVMPPVIYCLSFGRQYEKKAVKTESSLIDYLKIRMILTTGSFGQILIKMTEYQGLIREI
jgi:hypothetical protein